MTPRIVKRHHKNGAYKWYCETHEGGSYGSFTRVGSGYSPEEAYRKWANSVNVERMQSEESVRLWGIHSNRQLPRVDIRFRRYTGRALRRPTFPP